MCYARVAGTPNHRPSATASWSGRAPVPVYAYPNLPGTNPAPANYDFVVLKPLRHSRPHSLSICPEPGALSGSPSQPCDGTPPCPRPPSWHPSCPRGACRLRAHRLGVLVLAWASAYSCHPRTDSRRRLDPPVAPRRRRRAACHSSASPGRSARPTYQPPSLPRTYERTDPRRL